MRSREWWIRNVSVDQSGTSSRAKCAQWTMHWH